MEKDLLLYSKIFDTAQEGMTQSNLNFSFGKEAFLRFIRKNPMVISDGEFQNLEDDELFSLLYLRCLNRLPDPASKESLKHYKELSSGKKDVLLYCLIMYLTNSKEFKGLNKTFLLGNGSKLSFFSAYRKYGSSICKIYIFTLKMRFYGVIHRFFIEPIWKRLPVSFKNRIRRLFNREEKEC